MTGFGVFTMIVECLVFVTGTLIDPSVGLSDISSASSSLLSESLGKAGGRIVNLHLLFRSLSIVLGGVALFIAGAIWTAVGILCSEVKRRVPPLEV